MPLYIGHNADQRALMWFHLDTGFSGGLGVLQALAQDESSPFSYSEVTSSTKYGGWHGPLALSAGTIDYLAIAAYPALNWTGNRVLEYNDYAATDYPDAYQELAGYRIGGIVGGGFLAQFDYVIDYELSRLYLWPSAHDQ